MAELQLTLKHVKSTKGTHVYGDDAENAVIPSVYIKRHALPNDPPKELKVTITHES